MPATDHDSDVWETVSGWIFGCRTCLEHQVYAIELAALARKQVHDARSLPWWVKRIGADQPVQRTADTALDCTGCGDTIWPTEHVYEVGEGRVHCVICQVKSSGRGADQ